MHVRNDINVPPLLINFIRLKTKSLLINDKSFLKISMLTARINEH